MFGFLYATYLDNLGIEDGRIVSQRLGRNNGVHSERDRGKAEAIGEHPELIVSVTDLKGLQRFVSAVTVGRLGRRPESESLTRGATLKLAVMRITAAVSDTRQWFELKIVLHCVTMGAVIRETIKVRRH